MRRIDMSKDPRRKQFEYFRTFPNPYASLTANCDITHLRQTVLENGWPFFLTVLYCAVNAANAVPELRRRIVNGEVVEYESCISSHTVALPDETYCYCEIDCSGPFEQYLPRAQAAVEQAKQALSKGADIDDILKLDVREKIGRYKYTPYKDIESVYKNTEREIGSELSQLCGGGEV